MTYPAGYTMHTGQKDIESLIKNLVHKLTSYDDPPPKKSQQTFDDQAWVLKSKFWLNYDY